MRKRDLLSVAIDLPVVGSQENLLVGEETLVAFSYVGEREGN